MRRASHADRRNSSSVVAAFRWLQAKQAKTRLASPPVPPPLRGTRWSTVRASAPVSVKAAPQ